MNLARLNHILPRNFQRIETSNRQPWFASHPNGSLACHLDAMLKRRCLHNGVKTCLESAYPPAGDFPHVESLPSPRRYARFRERQRRSSNHQRTVEMLRPTRLILCAIRWGAAQSKSRTPTSRSVSNSQNRMAASLDNEIREQVSWLVSQFETRYVRGSGQCHW